MMESRKAKQQDLEKKESLQEIIALTKRAQYLEREKLLHYCLDCGLEEVCEELGKQRNKAVKELKQEIAGVQNSVSFFKRMMKDMKPGPTFMSKLSETLERIESSIVSFRKKQRDSYEELLKEERLLFQEVGIFERKLESFSAASSAPVHQHNARQQHPTAHVPPLHSALPSSVTAFEQYLHTNGGHCGNWEEFEHLTFIKIRQKTHSHDMQFIKTVARELPEKSVAEIERHEEWYKRYLELLEEKKKDIQSWRAQKRTDKDPKSEGSLASEESSSAQRILQEKLEKEKADKLSKLNSWRAQKEQDRLRMEEQKKERELRMAEEEKRVQLLKAQQKEKVLRYQEEKRKIAAQESLEAAREHLDELERKRTATRLLKHYQERDFQTVQMKLEKEKLKKQSASESEVKLKHLKDKVEVKVQRDPSRLLRPTQGSRERSKAATEPRRELGIQQVQRKTVPSWRQGL